MLASTFKLLPLIKTPSRLSRYRYLSVSAALHSEPPESHIEVVRPCKLVVEKPPVCVWSDIEFELSTSNIKVVIDDLRCDPSKALSFFRCVTDSGFVHNAETYLHIFRVLSGSKSKGKLSSLFEEILRERTGKHKGFEGSEVFGGLAEAYGDIEGDEDGEDRLKRACDALIKVYVRRDMFEEAEDALFQMRRKFVPHVWTCNFLLNSFVDKGKFDAVVVIYDYLKRAGFSPNVYTYTILMKAICRRRDDDFEDQGYNLFEKMAEENVKPDAYIYVTFIDGLCFGRKTAIGFNILQICRNNGIEIGTHGYNVVIIGFCKEGNSQEAEEVLKDMKEHRVTRNADSYKSLIEVYCNNREKDKALHLHDMMVSEGIKTNCYIVGYILQCLYKNGMAKDVVDYYFRFKATEYFADEVVFNIVITALCELSRLNEAMDLFEEMKGKKMVPDHIHYTSLINGYCLQGDLKEAKSLFDEMKETGLSPDNVTYTSLINGCLLQNKFEQAQSLLDEMKEMGLSGDAITLNVLSGALCRNNYVSEAYKLIDDIECVHGFKRDVNTYCTVIKCLCLGEHYEEAKSFTRRVVRENHELTNSVYSALIMGYAKSDQIDEAYEFWTENTVSTKACVELFSGLCEQNRGDEALEVLEKMLNSGMLEDNSYSAINRKEVLFHILIAVFCRTQNMKVARSLFDIFGKNGLNPSIITYTIMINGYCNAIGLKNRYYEAQCLFKDFEKRRMKPDIIMYTVMIEVEASLKKGLSNNFFDALAIRDHVGKMRIEPDLFFYTELIKSSVHFSNNEDALRLYDNLIKAGITPDAHTYTSLIRAYCSKGDIYGDKLLEEMKKKGVEPDEYLTNVLCDVCVEGQEDATC